jgi:hypothetical protein
MPQIPYPLRERDSIRKKMKSCFAELKNRGYLHQEIYTKEYISNLELKFGPYHPTSPYTETSVTSPDQQ